MILPIFFIIGVTELPVLFPPYIPIPSFPTFIVAKAAFVTDESTPYIPTAYLFCLGSVVETISECPTSIFPKLLTTPPLLYTAILPISPAAPVLIMLP